MNPRNDYYGFLRKRRWTPKTRSGPTKEVTERDDQIVELRAAGLSNADIAKQVSIPLSYLNKICSRLVREGRLVPKAKNRSMSITAHPNLHAVKFLTLIAEAVLRDDRIPTDEELDRALRLSLRGKATVETKIDWPGMKESFVLLMENCKADDRREQRKRFVQSFVRELSCRLDEAVAGIQFTDSTT